MKYKLLCTFTIDFNTGNWSTANSNVSNLISMDDTFIDVVNKVNFLTGDIIKINYK